MGEVFPSNSLGSIPHHKNNKGRSFYDQPLFILVELRGNLTRSHARFTTLEKAAESSSNVAKEIVL